MVITKNDIKELLYNEIGILEKRSRDLENAETKKAILDTIIEALDGDDYNEILEKTDILGLTLPLLYDENTSEKIYDKVFDNLYTLKAISTIIADEELQNDIDYEVAKKRFESVKKLFKTELKKEEITIEENKSLYNLNTMIECKRILTNLKYNQLVNLNQIKELEKILEWSNKDLEYQIRSFEVIKNHNQYVKNQMYGVKYIDKSQVLIMLDKEFTEYDDVYIEDITKRKIYDSAYDVDKNLIEECNDVDEIEDYLEKPSQQENPDMERFNYIMIKLIKYFENEMKEMKSMILEKDFYLEQSYKKEIVDDFNKFNSIYNRIRYIYSQENLLVSNKEIKEVKEIKNNIFYAAPIGSKKTYLENDVENNITEENLEKVSLLIDKLRTDTLSEDENKDLTKNKKYRGYKELRKDQIRVIYRHINNNNYLIIGVGTKKTDNDLTLYNKMVSRNNKIDISTEEKLVQKSTDSEKVKGKVLSYINDNKRKGNR